MEEATEVTSEKKFQCPLPFCLKNFTTRRSLVRHEKIHNGTTPSFECNICSKTFTTKPSLERHERVHTGEKPFQCDICFKTFSDNSNLGRHKVGLNSR